MMGYTVEQAEMWPYYASNVASSVVRDQKLVEGATLISS